MSRASNYQGFAGTIVKILGPNKEKYTFMTATNTEIRRQINNLKDKGFRHHFGTHLRENYLVTFL